MDGAPMTHRNTTKWETPGTILLPLHGHRKPERTDWALKRIDSTDLKDTAAGPK